MGGFLVYVGMFLDGIMHSLRAHVEQIGGKTVLGSKRGLPIACIDSMEGAGKTSEVSSKKTKKK